jgi:hypothetical protein
VLHALRRAGFAPVWQRVEAEDAYLAALDDALDLMTTLRTSIANTKALWRTTDAWYRTAAGRWQ